MDDAFIGEIRLFPYDFAPETWAFCDGQLLSVQQNQALFSIIGARFGGDGRTTFGVPNLQGSAAMGFGAGPGLSDREFASRTGSDSVTLTSGNMPRHEHSMSLGSVAAALKTASPAIAAPLSLVSSVLNGTVNVKSFVQSGATPNATMASGALGPAGGPVAAPHENRQPYLALHYFICLDGEYPQPD